MKQDVDTVIKFQEKNMNDKKYMLLALKEAKKAYDNGDVPVGCVIVLNDKVIAKAHNIRQLKRDTVGHAEIVAIKKACKKLNSWILEDATIYVTLEPCLMCTGAIIQTRIKKVVFGAFDPKGGAIESALKVNEVKGINHRFESISKVLEKDCSMILKNYFKSKRN